MHEYWINTDTFSYPVIIGRRTLGMVGSIIIEKRLIQGQKVAMITSDPIYEVWGDMIIGSFIGTGLDVRLIRVPDGERAKELDCLDHVYTELARFGLHRDGLIIALGGGSISDVAGFAASTFLRGVDYINVPTTFLAQIDSCVGGKTGINHAGGKNLVGTFWQPRGVIVDPEIIQTLDGPQVRSGMGEAVKYGVIADNELFIFIENNFDSLVSFSDPDGLDFLIDRSLRIKIQYVEADHMESHGYRAQLNFGHTFGHAFEALLRVYGDPISHGEAVALGMLAESRLAVLLGMLQRDDEARIANLALKITDPSKISKLEWADVLSLLNIDKKARDEGVYFALPTSIGSVELVGDVDEPVMKKALEEITPHTG